MDKARSNETTLVMRAITDQLGPPEPVELPGEHIVHDALELLADLWPRPTNATVTLEPGDWPKLRQVLLSVPVLWMEANK